MSCSSDLRGSDYRLFQNTPVWDLAKAVEDEDTVEIRRIVAEEKPDIDYQESKFGQTLLMMTIKNQQYNSCKVLLELGAGPNKHDNYDGTSAMIWAAGVENYRNDNTVFLRLLLEHGGDPNDEETGERREGNTTRKTPLLYACHDFYQHGSPLEKIKILVEAGANVNHINEYDNFPLKEALLHDHYDVTLYLLENGADHSVMLIDRAKFTKGGKKIYISDYLRECVLPLDSREYRKKMEIVGFLKQKGIDYRSTPIPDYVIKEAKETYPANWKEYLEKY